MAFSKSITTPCEIVWSQQNVDAKVLFHIYKINFLTSNRLVSSSSSFAATMKEVSTTGNSKVCHKNHVFILQEWMWWVDIVQINHIWFGLMFKNLNLIWSIDFNAAVVQRLKRVWLYDKNDRKLLKKRSLNEEMYCYKLACLQQIYQIVTMCFFIFEVFMHCVYCIQMQM